VRLIRRVKGTTTPLLATLLLLSLSLSSLLLSLLVGRGTYASLFKLRGGKDNIKEIV
jgi:hypothetical protein